MSEECGWTGGCWTCVKSGKKWGLLLEGEECCVEDFGTIDIPLKKVVYKLANCTDAPAGFSSVGDTFGLVGLLLFLAALGWWWKKRSTFNPLPLARFSTFFYGLDGIGNPGFPSDSVYRDTTGSDLELVNLVTIDEEMETDF